MANTPPHQPLLDSPTVLVLGAGASAPFGLPLGSDLRTLIIKNQFMASEHNQHETYQFIQSIRTDSGPLSEALRQSPVESIDEFLSRRKTLHDIGKMSIASYLVPMEAKAARASLAADWHRWFFRQLVVEQDRLDFGKLSVVTFNYDRTLELALATMLASHTGRDVISCWNDASEWPIYHVHGRLASQVKPQTSTRLFVCEEAEDLVASARSLHIVGEDRRSSSSSAIHSEIRQRIHAAHRVVFLGFGFDQTNLETLGIPGGRPWGPANRWAGGTGFGLRGRPLADAEWSISAQRSVFDMKCHEFLETHFSARRRPSILK